MEPGRYYTDEEKRQLIANLDIEGILPMDTKKLELKSYL